MEAVISNLVGSMLSFGMASLVWKVIEKRLEKIDEIERRLTKLEIKDELTNDAGQRRPTSPRDKPQP